MDSLIPLIDSHLVDLPSTMAVLPLQLPSSRSNYLFKVLYSRLKVLLMFMYFQYILVVELPDLVEMPKSESEQSTMDLVLHSPSSVVRKLLVLFHQQRHHFSTSMVLQKRDLERATTMALVHSLHLLVLQNLLLSTVQHRVSSSLLVLLQKRIPKIMLERVLSLDLLQRQNLLLSTVQHLDSSNSLVEQSRRTPKIMLVLVLYLDSTVLQKQQKSPAKQTVSSRFLEKQQTYKLYSVIVVLVHSSELLVMPRQSHLIITVIPQLLILGQIIMDSSLNLYLTRQFLIMLMSRLAPMQMR